MIRLKLVALLAVVAAVAIITAGTGTVDGQERLQEAARLPEANVKLLRPTPAVLQKLERVTLPAQRPRMRLDARLVSRLPVAVQVTPTPVEGVDLVVESCEVTCIALTTRAEVACPDGVDPLTMALSLRWVTRNRGNQGASFYAGSPGRMVFQVTSEIPYGSGFGTIAPAEGLYVGPGESFTNNHEFYTYASTPGEHRFVVEVDANQPCCDVNEADETNNVCVPTYRVVAANLPDPAITSVTIAPNPGASNAAFTAHVTVTNRGSASTAAGTILLCTSFSSAGLPVLAPGASTMLDLPRSSSGSIPPGVKTITCEIGNQFGNTLWTNADSDVTNNQATASYTVAN